MIERSIERVIFVSRWLMAPIYLGLVAVLGVLVVKFLEELWHFVRTCSTRARPTSS
jgi:uncharacterized protein (TIGR00645 family)